MTKSSLRQFLFTMMFTFTITMEITKQDRSIKNWLYEVWDQVQDKISNQMFKNDF